MLEQLEKLLVIKENEQQILAKTNDSTVTEQESTVEQDIAFLRFLVRLWKESKAL